MKTRPFALSSGITANYSKQPFYLCVCLSAAGAAIKRRRVRCGSLAFHLRRGNPLHSQTLRGWIRGLKTVSSQKSRLLDTVGVSSEENAVETMQTTSKRDTTSSPRGGGCYSDMQNNGARCDGDRGHKAIKWSMKPDEPFNDEGSLFVPTRANAEV